MKKINLKREMLPVVFALIGVFIFESCIGLKSDVTLKDDGSGTIVLEYRMAKALESLGRQDGNENRLPLPVGRADVDRTLKRVPGLTLRSFSSREEGKDIIINLKMEFSGMEALVKFFDYSGTRSAYTVEGGKKRLSLELGEGARSRNEALEELFPRAAAGYSLDFAFTLPAEGSLAVTDREGRTVPALAGAGSKGRAVSCHIPLLEVFNAREGLNLELAW